MEVYFVKKIFNNEQSDSDDIYSVYWNCFSNIPSLFK